MSHPQDPFGHNMFGDEPIFEYPASDPVVDYPADGPFEAPPTSPHPQVNTLATLSLVFAFVFAPAGAILGHLGLAQIRRTGQRGRERALAGVTLSYVFITLAVAGLVGWATLPGSTANRPAERPPGSLNGATPPTATVAADGLAGLLPGITEVRRLTGDPNLTVGETRERIGRYDNDATIDRTECWGSIGPGTPDAYNVEALFGYRASTFSDPPGRTTTVQVIQGVAALRDAAGAQNQLTTLLSGWQQCGGSDVKVTFPSAQALTFSLGVPTDAGDGITTLERKTQGIQQRRSARALAAKANVIVDLDVTYTAPDSSADPQRDAVAIAKYILAKIPG